jgi:hypothetical protein
VGEPSWRKIAEILGHRMENHAYCPDHPESQPGEVCPFCADRVAYRMWQKKAGVTDPPPYRGETFNVLAEAAKSWSARLQHGGE